MDFKRLASISFIAWAVLGLSLIAAAQDVNLTSNGKVLGQPFEALQQQIDDLQYQIDNLQIGLVKAYFTAAGDIKLTDANQFVPVLELNLPKGFYVSNMALSVSASRGVEDNYLDCRYINGDTESYLSGLFGINVGLIRQLAHTFIFELFEDSTRVVLTCEPLNPTDNWEYSYIYHAELTVIKVGEITRP